MERIGKSESKRDRSGCFAGALTLVLVGAVTGSGSTGAAVTPPATRQLGFAERVAAQRAVEEVYWRHRIWPGQDSRPKPPLAEILPDETIRAKVEDYLRKSDALETWWQRPITSDQLQAELVRMARQTRDPGMLQELYSALGNDPFLIAETLARQTLADRLIRNWYALDDRFHGAVKRRAERALASLRSVAEMKALGGDYSERTFVRRGFGEDMGRGGPQPEVVDLSSVEWDDWMERLAGEFATTPDAIPQRRVSRLQEDRDGFFVTAALSLLGQEAVLASVVWPKRPFDAWWSEERAGMSVELVPAAGPYEITPPSGGTCQDDTWQESFALPSGRRYPKAVWTGTEMIVWGGLNDGGSLNTGGRYSPATDSWTVTSTAGAPLPRSNHTAVWTGTEMIVWGGTIGSNLSTETGGRYDPMTDTWVQTFMIGAPSPRWYHTAVWTGVEMIVWGGREGDIFMNTGGRYDPVADTWSATSVGANVPSPRNNHAAVWTGTELIVWGGSGFSTILNTGGRYDPVADTWSATSVGANVPSPRGGHTAVWTGSKMIVWGGSNGSGLNTGGRYDPATDGWAMTSTGAGVPVARFDHTAVWTGSKMIVWGGSNGSGLNTGGRYDPVADTWSATSVGANVPSPRSAHAAVWTGTELIVWGGWNISGITYEPNTGGRYDPATDQWTPTSTGMNVPSERERHTSVWTGAEVIVWGGYLGNGNALNSGGRYDPAMDSWTTTSAGAGVPSPRYGHTAVWTGTAMIVWGGRDGSALTNTGGRYDPVSDSWAATSLGANVPAERVGHTAVWTGTEMIVWGGINFGGLLNSGARYLPAANVWSSTSMGANVPSPRLRYSAVWSGTEMIVWGGTGTSGAGTDFSTGGRYDPATDGWIATSLGPNVPSPRELHAAVWTGSKMIVWGGWDSGTGTFFDSGAKYDPATDGWTATSAGTGTPSPRSQHSGVWTGKEMIVFGGFFDPNPTDFIAGDVLDTGGRYDPITDGWTPTSVGGALPSPRRGHTVEWTGTRMLAWGGRPFDSNLLLYCASGSSSAGAVSNLRLQRDGADLHLSWDADCGLGDSYGIYRGDLSQGYDSIVGDVCDVATTEATIGMGLPHGEFFLVVPSWNGQDGSYGAASASERPPALSACRAQGVIDWCAP